MKDSGIMTEALWTSSAANFASRAQTGFKHMDAIIGGCTTLLAMLILGLVPARVSAAVDVPETVLKAQEERIESIERAKQATISIFGAQDAGAGGSGVIVSADGFALS